MSAVVNLRENSSETALGRLARIPHVGIYGLQENKLVAVIECATLKDASDVMAIIARLDEVMEVNPVYLADIRPAMQESPCSS